MDALRIARSSRRMARTMHECLRRCLIKVPQRITPAPCMRRFGSPVAARFCRRLLRYEVPSGCDKPPSDFALGGSIQTVTRRRLHLAIALLLPLMVLRAMLPTGYMPVTENGTLRIAMCSDGLYRAAVSTVGDRASDPGDHELPSGSSDCAFANAALNAPPPAATLAAVSIDSDAGAVLAHAAPTRSVALVRVQSARGPPSRSL